MFSLERAQAVHNSGGVPRTLQSLSIDSFIRQADAFPSSEWPEEWEDGISHILKNDILQQFLKYPDAIESIESIHSFVHLLLNEQTKALNLFDWHIKGYWPEKGDRQVLEMLEAVVHKAPHLQHLTIHCSQRESLTRSEVMGYIRRLTHLRYLSLDFVNSGLQNDELLDLPQHLPRLEILKLKLGDEVTTDGLLNFNLWTNLKEFHFYLESATTADVKKIYVWCLVNLRSLRLVGQSAENDSGQNTKIIHPITVPLAGTLANLEHLHCTIMPPKIVAPKLKHLMFGNYHFTGGYTSHSVDAFDRIASYSALVDLTFMDTTNFFPLLEKIGGRLEKFCFAQIFDQAIDYFRILFLCPNLRHLTQAGHCYIAENSGFRAVALVPAHLKECIIHASQSSLPTGLLNLILKAPNLESLSVRGVVFTQEECQIPVLMSEQGFPKLMNLKLLDIALKSGCDLESFADMMKGMVCLSPNLGAIAICWHRNVKSEDSKRWKDMDVHEYLKVVYRNAKQGHTKYSMSNKIDNISNLTQWHYW